MLKILDFLNRDLGGDDLSKLPLHRLVRLGDEIDQNVAASFLQSSADRLEMSEQMRAAWGLLDRKAAIQLELSKRQLRWKAQRWAFIIVILLAIFSAFLVISLLLRP